MSTAASATATRCFTATIFPEVALPSLSCRIFTARSDASFIRHTLPSLCNLASKAGTTPTVVVDATPPRGVLGRTLPQANLSKLLSELEHVRRDGCRFEVETLRPDPPEVRRLNRLHFGRAYRETHCFRGYPVFGSIRQFHLPKETDYVLHLDCDMLFHEAEGFSWILEGMKVMEENEDVICVLPRGGPPTEDGELQQGTTRYDTDSDRGLYLFTNFTSRHYLVHRERFLSLLPMKPAWLSWREPFKSLLFGNGKMLCWETSVERALERSRLRRADLMTDQAWSLHPGDRSELFHRLLPSIVKAVNTGRYPPEQAGHFDLLPEPWQKHLT